MGKDDGYVSECIRRSLYLLYKNKMTHHYLAPLFLQDYTVLSAYNTACKGDYSHIVFFVCPYETDFLILSQHQTCFKLRLTKEPS